MKRLLIIGLFFLNLSCLGEGPMDNEGDNPPPPPPQASESEETISRVVIYPPYLALHEPGESYQLTAEVTFQTTQKALSLARAGETENVVSWSSDDEGIATVDSSGLVIAVSVGVTTIRAKAGDKTGAVYLVVREEEATSDETPSDKTPIEEPESSAGTITPLANCDPIPGSADPFADRVVSYRIGTRGGYHEELMPEIVLGPPHGAGNAPGGTHGGFDVFSLGLRGEIILEFTDFYPCNGEGPDLIVFENSFFGFFEPAQAYASPDGVTWHRFPCQWSSPFNGCAGGNPVYANPDQNDIDPTDPETAGGDSYDLADVGLLEARFLKIRDINGCSFYNDLAHCSDGAAPGVLGFDLDAAAVVNGKAPRRSRR